MTRPYFATVNGIDWRTMGVEVHDVTGLWQTPTVTLDEQALYHRAGVTLMDDEPASAVRELVLSTTVLGTDADDFEAKLLAVKRTLGPIGRRDLVLVFGNQTAQQITARYVGVSDGPTDPQMLQRRVPVAFHFRALDPWFVDVTPTTLGPVTGTPVAIPLGTELSLGVTTITFAGSAASVTLTYASSAGTPLATLTATHAFVASDVLAIDHDARTITLNGVRHDELLTAGDFLRFDPSDGVPATPAWPTIASDHGALTVVYRRVW